MAFAHGYPMADLMRMREAMSRLSHSYGGRAMGKRAPGASDLNAARRYL